MAKPRKSSVVLGCCFVFSGFLAGHADEAKSDPDPQRTAIMLESLSRLKGVDLETNPAVKAAVLKVLSQVRGSPQFVRVVNDFNIKDQESELLEIATANSTNTFGAEAMKLILHSP